MDLCVTGYGHIGALALGRDALARALAAKPAPEPRVSDAPIARASTGRASLCLAQETWEAIGLDPKSARQLDRLAHVVVGAARMALHDSGLKRDGEWVATDPRRVGICSATFNGSIDLMLELHRTIELMGPKRMSPARFPSASVNVPAGQAGIWEGMRGANATLVNGNCGAVDAMFFAEMQLASRRADALLVGGGEILCDSLVLALERIARARDAEEIKLGEGAAFACLELADTAARRGRAPLAHVIGYGTSFDPPKGEGRLFSASAVAVERAVRMAIDDAGIESRAVDLVASSISGFLPFDRAERAGIEAVLSKVPIAMPKRLFGETFGAGPAQALGAVLAWFAGAPVAPCSPACEVLPRIAVVTAVGFYGNASAMVLRRPDTHD